jgi:N-terminal domain with HPIH motif
MCILHLKTLYLTRRPQAWSCQLDYLATNPNHPGSLPVDLQGSSKLNIVPQPGIFPPISPGLSLSFPTSTSAKMLAAWLFPAARRGEEADQHKTPGVLSRSLTPVLLSFSKCASTHPVYTIIATAFLASTTYLGLLESSLFGHRISANNAIGRIDLKYLLAGSKKLYSGPETTWKWTAEDVWIDSAPDDVSYPQNITYHSKSH